jgi:hypothetical protein
MQGGKTKQNEHSQSLMADSICITTADLALFTLGGCAALKWTLYDHDKTKTRSSS